MYTIPEIIPGRWNAASKKEIVEWRFQNIRRYIWYILCECINECAEIKINKQSDNCYDSDEKFAC